MSKVEYRVRWRREGLRPATKRYATREAAERWALIVQGRMQEATDKDPDDYACCPGGYADMCGCYGRTNAQVWAQRTAEVPPLIEGPVIQTRPVGEWSE